MASAVAMWALQGVMFCSASCDSLGGVLARAIWRMRAADASGTHSLTSSIVSSVFFIVSFVFISLVIIISEHTVATVVVNGMHSMWMTHGPRE